MDRGLPTLRQRIDNKATAIDPERDETLNILNDLVQLSRRSENRQHERADSSVEPPERALDFHVKRADAGSDKTVDERANALI